MFMRYIKPEDITVSINYDETFFSQKWERLKVGEWFWECNDKGDNINFIGTFPCIKETLGRIDRYQFIGEYIFRWNSYE